MNKMISSFLKFVPNEEWILKNSRRPWLELKVSVPHEQIAAEAAPFYDQSVLHRSDDTLAAYSHRGWRSLTLYGIDPYITEHRSGEHDWTDVGLSCPITREFIEQHWIIDKSTRRIRFMWLDPQGFILPHHDREASGFYESNIAIYHPTGCVFRFLDYGNIPFETGRAFMPDISNRHMVVNSSDAIRLHMIVHAHLKPGLIKRSYEQSFYS